GAEAHQRARDREAVAADELDELGRGVRVDDASARVDHGALRGGERLRGLAYLLLVAVGARLVARQAYVGHGLVGDLRAREVLRDVDEHGSRATGARDVKRLVDRA